MENFLRNDFTTHYHLDTCTASDFVVITDDPYFELEDTQGEIVLHSSVGMGMARFSNQSRLSISIANYDKFVTGLPNAFQRGKRRCDIIVCDDTMFFILGEIKDSSNLKHHRKEAKKQLLASLLTLKAVPQILEEINRKTVKRCCYFNKQPNVPTPINAVTAFNRLPAFFAQGLQMSHAGIEEQNFEFWEYAGTQTFMLHT